MSQDYSTTELPVAAPGKSAPVKSAARRSAEKHLVTLVLSLVVLTLAALLSVQGETQVDIPFINRPLPPLCAMKRFVGWDCPGCGLTRCFISIAHGDMASAWHFNPAGLLVFALVALQIPYRTMQLWRLRRGLPEWTHRRLSSALTIVLVSALLLQWMWKFFTTASPWNG